GPELAVDARVASPHRRGRLQLGLRQHELSPGPEIRAAAAAAQRALEGVAMGVDETGQGEGLGHGRILSTHGDPRRARAAAAAPERADDRAAAPDTRLRGPDAE